MSATHEDKATAPTDTSPIRDRREFLRFAGLSGAALAFAGCSSSSAEVLAPPLAQPPTPGTSGAVVAPNGDITLDFSNELDVLNYAYALEQLEAAFYIQVVANVAFGGAFSASEQRVLRDIRDHEVVHRDFFGAALGTFKIPDLTPAFGTINFADRTSVLRTAQVFEDLGVSAYNGAARYLRSEVYLTLAGKIVSVEARHASAIRDIINPRSGDFAPNAFDMGNTPQTVLTAADPFIVQNITVINT